jgi:hypothetical protein
MIHFIIDALGGFFLFISVFIFTLWAINTIDDYYRDKNQIRRPK